jgi:chemotaxis protein methyltransferase WspC
MELKIIEELLKKKIGLDGNRVNSTHISRAVSERMQASGCLDLASYLRRLQMIPQELEDLIEQVVVPETYFFRDREAFACMKNFVTTRWLPNPRNRVLRVLSIPCSTGEEPYSIAITLLEAGLLPPQFRIDAIDISHKSIAFAKHAVYSPNSFRGDYLEFRDRYFQLQGSAYKLKNSVSSLVHFQHGNILNSMFLASENSYDAVWCRNLLIYFESADQMRAMQTIDRLIAPEGLLFLGYSETGLLKTDRFVPVRHPRAFAYQKVERAKPPTQPISSPPVRQPAVQLQAANPSSNRFGFSKNLSPAPPPPQRLPQLSPYAPIPQAKVQTAESSLDKAKNLANSGHLQEALGLCEQFVSQNRTNADGYILLGEIYQASGNNDKAEANYQKAIYLDPGNYKALFHLTQIKESQGNLEAAHLFRMRLQQAHPTSSAFR